MRYKNYILSSVEVHRLMQRGLITMRPDWLSKTARSTPVKNLSHCDQVQRWRDANPDAVKRYRANELAKRRAKAEAKRKVGK